MTPGEFRSRGVTAVVAAAVASSVLAFVILLFFGQFRSPQKQNWIGAVPVIAAVVLIWAPAFATVPAGILGLLVERPKARAMIRRSRGGIVPFALLSVVAAALLWLVFRIGLYFTNSSPHFMDPFSLALFLLIGLCSGVSWWFLVVEPGRRG